MVFFQFQTKRSDMSIIQNYEMTQMAVPLVPPNTMKGAGLMAGFL